VKFLRNGTTINFAVYCETLKKLWLEIQNKEAVRLSLGILLLQDNARRHCTGYTEDVITSFGWGQMNIPDLPASDFTSSYTSEFRGRRAV
jgi:hypothetical protein